MTIWHLEYCPYIRNQETVTHALSHNETIYAVYGSWFRFAQFLSQERKARSSATKKATLPAPKLQPAPAPKADEAKPPKAPKSAEAKPPKAPKAAEAKPPKTAATEAKPKPEEEPPKVAEEPAAGAATKSAVEKVIATQPTEMQERAYVTFPYYPTEQQFFDNNPFQTATTHHYAESAFTDPVYTKQWPGESQSMQSMPDRWGDQSWSEQSSSTRSSSSFYDDSSTDQSSSSSYTFYENNYQMSYPQQQSTSSSQVPAHGSSGSSHYQDYFNIFS